jgi:hypothetical protein
MNFGVTAPPKDGESAVVRILEEQLNFIHRKRARLPIGSPEYLMLGAEAANIAMQLRRANGWDETTKEDV